MNIPVFFDPRPYQEEALRALHDGVKIAIWCWARRGGKDFTAYNYAIERMVDETMAVAIVWPTQKQGYDNFWTNIDNDGRTITDHIPKNLIHSVVSAPNNMKITLKNGSTLTLLGATEPNKLRGANAKLYIFSEFVDIDSAALDVIRPIVAANGGQIIIQSTPKIDGISGGTFKILFDRALANWTTGNRTQYASRITANAYLSAEVLAEIREETIAKNGNDFWYKQEFECDWGQASSTSYYGAALGRNNEIHNLGYFPYDPGHPVYTAWDLGTSDSTAITFFQVMNKKVRFIDYYETHDVGYKAIIEALKLKPYNMAWHFIPHDGTVRDQTDAIRRIDKMRDYGLTNASVLRRENKEDGINRAVEKIVNTQINVATTEELIRKLIIYKRKFNPLTGDYEGPEHKTESHAADSTQYVYTAIDQYFDKQTGEFLYSPGVLQTSYETEKFRQPAYFRPR